MRLKPIELSLKCTVLEGTITHLKSKYEDEVTKLKAEID
jgi:hypothetical protein